MEGAAVANAVTFALSKWARLALVRRFVRIQPYDRHYARLILPSLAGAAVMWIVHAAMPSAGLLDLGATAVAGTAAYLSVYLVAGLTTEERAGVAKIVGRLRAGR
jgi:hypothetical protein